MHRHLVRIQIKGQELLFLKRSLASINSGPVSETFDQNQPLTTKLEGNIQSGIVGAHKTH